MRRTFSVALIALLAACASTPPAPLARSGDDFDIESTVLANYNVISGPAGRRDWDRMAELYAPGARIVSRGTGGELLVQSVDEFVAARKPELEKTALFEHPASTHIDRWNDTAHVTSTYESRHNATDAQPFAHGIDSIQLVRTPGGWKIVTIVRQPL
jgi:hypothetical protein